MATYQDTFNTLSQLRSLLSGGGDDSVFTQTQKMWIAKLYKKETGSAIRDCGCKNKYADAVLELHRILKARGTSSEEQHYRLRRGVLIWLGTECYSIHNCTDEVAQRYLELHPDAKDKFEHIAE